MIKKQQDIYLEKNKDKWAIYKKKTYIRKFYIQKVYIYMKKHIYNRELLIKRHIYRGIHTEKIYR